ncbi:MAG: molybdenum cofactor biosynthesis protein [Nannocystaceae bacterium]
MQVSVLLFAGLRQRLGRPRVEINIDAGITAAELLQRLADRYPDLAPMLGPCRVAVDHTFVRNSETIGDPPGELAIIPPVSGGHNGSQQHQAPTTDPAAKFYLGPDLLKPQAVLDAVSHRHAGGLTSFVGNVRRRSRGHDIERLEYTAYEPMALAVMRTIAAEIEAEIPETTVAIHHRLGVLTIGQTAVVIAASAPHRDEAFRACRAAIEALKRDVPIWKQEVAVDGQSWFGQGP